MYSVCVCVLELYHIKIAAQSYVVHIVNALYAIIL